MILCFYQPLDAFLQRFTDVFGIPTGITQNVKDLLTSREVSNVFENSDFVYMLNQAQGDREILAKQLNISQQQMTYVTPVSYTHLDVYKRQGLYRPLVFYAFQNGEPCKVGI